MYIQLHQEVIETYIELLEEALIQKRVILDSGDYSGLIIILKDEQLEPLKILFKKHNAYNADWGSTIFLDEERRTRMYLSTYTKKNLSVYVDSFPTYGMVTSEYRENVDKFIKHLNLQGWRDNKINDIINE